MVTRGMQSKRVHVVWLTVSLMLLITVEVGIGCYSAEVDMFKTGGDINIGEANDGAKITTMGGDIRLESVRGEARLKTYGGDIDVGSASGSVLATTMAGNITVHVRDNEADSREHVIKLESNSGAISLFLPPGFGAQVDLQLAYTNNQAAVFRIIENIGLKQAVSDTWSSPWGGTPRKYITARGVIGDGKHHIVIRTVNGDITVQRAAS